MGKTQSQKLPRTVAFTITGGFVARYFLRSGLLDRLSHDGFKILILTPNPEEEYFRKEFERQNVYIEKLETEQIRAFVKKSKLIPYFQLLRFLCMQELTTIKMHYLEHRLERNANSFKSKVFWAFFDTALNILRKSIMMRNLLVKIETILLRADFHKELFRQYHPDLLICSTMGFAHTEVDAFLLREAKRYQIKTLAFILSWDNTTGKGWRGATPDYVINWTSIMKQELVMYHKYPEERCFISGPLHFDIHFKDLTASREDFLKSLGLEPDRKTITLFTYQPLKYPYHADIIKILGKAIKDGKFNKDVQFIVRIHPIWMGSYLAQGLQEFVNLCNSYPHFVTDKPEVLSQKLALDMPWSDMQKLSALCRYSDVIVNLYSTVTIEACIHDTPVVNINFNGFATQPLAFRKDVDKMYQNTHVQRVQEMGATTDANSPEELIQYINMYLNNPEINSQKRKQLAKQECEYLDGLSTERAALIIKQLTN
ncbi:hypothetical protein ACFLUZ_04065 [Chloroflexota bacterium]